MLTRLTGIVLSGDVFSSTSFLYTKLPGCDPVNQVPSRKRISPVYSITYVIHLYGHVADASDLVMIKKSRVDHDAMIVMT